MSRLAAVHTGQPTQGLGTVPAATKLAARQHASPLQAQRAEAEAEASGALTIEDLVPEPLEPVVVNPRSAHSAASATVAAAWLSLSATELEVRKYFRSVPAASGLEMLAKMRKQCDMAAETLQTRMDEGNTEHCTGCGKTLEEARKSQFIMMGSEVDSETGVPMPYRFCSPMCVRERNREKMLPPEDRKKLRFDGREMGDIG